MRYIPILCTLLLAFTTGCSAVKVRIAETKLLPQIRNLSPDEKIATLIEKAREESRSGEVSPATVDSLIKLLQTQNFTAKGIHVVRTGKHLINPSQCPTLIPAANLKIGGFHQRSLQAGQGVPYVAYFPKDSPFLTGQPGIPPAGLALPVNALLTFDNSTPTLRFFDLTKSDRTRINGRTVRLAGDFSAPLALVLSKGKNRAIDVQALFFSRRNFANLGLIQIEPYDPQKIPVVFVHGLLSRPEAWAHAMNQLLADPTIRERYQFWFYLYPTGLPVWVSAAGLRRELDRFDADAKKLAPGQPVKPIVLVGHSMGGLICNMLIREGGDKLWGQFSDIPLNQLQLGPEAHAKLREFIDFKPRKDVNRVIFIATPHRGSRLALRPLAGFLANLIQLPKPVVAPYRKYILAAIREESRKNFTSPANSIRFLRADSPLLLAILKLPKDPRIPFHTIFGDRGRGNAPESSDGVVPYWSSNLPGAVSEKVVPSGHGANENSQGIEEIRRILSEN